MYKQNANKLLTKTLLQLQNFALVCLFLSLNAHWETLNVITIRQLHAQNQQ